MNRIDDTGPQTSNWKAKQAISKKIRLGTRGSKLALWQSNWIAGKLRESFPELEVELKIFTTQGDRIQDRPLQSLSNDGFFVRELEDALLRNEIDLAVHSLKDLPHKQPEGLIVPAVPCREDARDVLLSRGDKKLSELPFEAKIGTSSTRRASQLLAYRSDFQIYPLRGNVDTRIRKLAEGDKGVEYDAIILAAAGIERLGRGSEITEKISFEIMLPAPGQGALAPECRSTDADLLEILASLNDIKAQKAVEFEKAFLGALGGGCQTPVGCYLTIDGPNFLARGFVGSPEGDQTIRVELSGEFEARSFNALKLAEELAGIANAKGAGKLLDEARARGFITPRA